LPTPVDTFSQEKDQPLKQFKKLKLFDQLLHYKKVTPVIWRPERRENPRCQPLPRYF
jgi:hypothetical protein